MTDELLKAQMILLYPEEYSEDHHTYAQKVLAHHHEAQDFINELQEVRTYVDQSYQDSTQPSSDLPSMHLHVSHTETNILSTQSRSVIMNAARQQIVHQKNVHSQASIEASASRPAWWQLFFTPQFTALAVLSVLTLFVWQPSLMTLDSEFSISEEIQKINHSPVDATQLKELIPSPVRVPVSNEGLLHNKTMLTSRDHIDHSKNNKDLANHQSDRSPKPSLDAEDSISIQKTKVSRKSKQKKRSQSNERSKSLKSYSPGRRKANKKRKRKVARKKRKNRKNPKSNNSNKSSIDSKKYKFESIGEVEEVEVFEELGGVPKNEKVVGLDRLGESEVVGLGRAGRGGADREGAGRGGSSRGGIAKGRTAQKKTAQKKTRHRSTSNTRLVLPWQQAQEAYQQSAIQDALRYLLSWIERNPTHPRYQEALHLGIQWATQHKQNRYVDLFRRLKNPPSQNKKSIKNSRSYQSSDQSNKSSDQSNIEDSNSENQKAMDPTSF